MFSVSKPRNIIIKIKQPNPYQEVGAKFIVSGWVSAEWLKSQFGMDYRIFLDYIDINGQTFSGSSFDVKRGLISRLTNRYCLSTVLGFTQFNVDFIKKSQGRITIKLGGQNKHEIYIPVIVKQLEPEGGADPEIIKKHGKIGSMINQYENDLKIYNEKIEKIRTRRLEKLGLTDKEISGAYIQDFEIAGKIAGGIFQILEKENGYNSDYPLAQEDLDEKELEEKYKDAIEWRGPLLGVAIGRMNGFEFMVFSNDHGKHLHVIHRARGINARFSFPEIELINYKNAKNSINSKEKKEIAIFLRNPEIHTRLDNEFKRRETVMA